MLKTFPDLVKFSEVPPKEIKKFTGSFPPYSDFNYTSIFSWNVNDRFQVSKFRNNLVILFEDYVSGEQFFTFIGKRNSYKTVLKLLEYTSERPNYVHELRLIPEFLYNKLKNKTGIVIEEDPGNFDYILGAQEYIELKGKRFESKRKKLNQFQRQIGPRANQGLIDLDEERSRDTLMTLAKNWQSFNTDGAQDALNELKAIGKLLDNYSFLKKFNRLACFGIWVDDKLEAFCIFEILDKKNAITHFGKANLTVDNLYDYLMAELLKYLALTNIQYVNNEQDLNIPGLRSSKLSQKPIGFLKKYKISLNKRT